MILPLWVFDSITKEDVAAFLRRNLLTAGRLLAQQIVPRRLNQDLKEGEPFENITGYAHQLFPSLFGELGIEH